MTKRRISLKKISEYCPGNYFLLFSVILLLLTAFGCDRDGSKWEKTQTEETKSAYELYLKEFPEGKFATQAAGKIEQYAWEETADTSDITVLETFIETYPESRYSVQAKEKLENLIWKNAEQAGKVQTYQAYLERFPEGRYADQARTLIEKTDWENAVASKTAKGYKDFIKKHPESTHIPKATFLSLILEGNDAGRYDDLKAVGATITGFEGDKGKITFDFDTLFQTSTMRVQTMSIQPASNLIYQKGAVKKGQKIDLYMAFMKGWHGRLDWNPVGFWIKKQ